jgi:D-alanine-D-alanine ligase
VKKRHIKVAIVYNESAPEMYEKPAKRSTNSGVSNPFSELEDLTPIEEYEYLVKRLKKLGFNAYSLNILDNIHRMLDDFEKNKPDVIFNFVELYRDNPLLEMNIVGVYELLGISYTGATAMALANCQNKILAKRLFIANGILVPDFFVVKKKAKNYRRNLKFPLLVKPSLEDASVGIENESVVKNTKQLKERIDYILDYFEQPALIEAYIEGRELNVSVLGDKDPVTLPISEIDFSTMPDHLHNIVSFQAKWDPEHEAYQNTGPICPAKIPRKIELKAKEIALKAFKILGCRDYARIDLRLSKDNKLYLLEVNPNPDLTDGAGFMRSASASGLSYAQSLKKIIQLAYSRRNKK